MEITREYLQEYFSYSPSTGDITRLKSQYHPRLAGQVAGCVGNNGYVSIKVNGMRFLAHRLAHVLMTGNWPPEHMDHLNGVRDDNRWKNLRAATRSENLRNSKRYTTNSTGIAGVRWRPDNKKWQARIRNAGRMECLGSTPDFFEACCRRKSAELKHNYTGRTK